MKINQVLLLTAWALAGCSQADPVRKATSSETPEVLATETPEVLATIDGAPVTLSDLDELVGDRLAGMESQYRSQRHQLVDSAVKKIVTDRLLEKEAESRGISKEELIAAEIESKVDVTDQDVQTWYRTNQARLGGRSLPDVASQIRQFLLKSETERVQEDFVKELEKQRNVVYLVEPYRFDLETEGLPSTGPSDAPITLVEFSDFECPYCSQFVGTLDRVKNKYSDRVRIVFRQFPLSIHPNAPKAAEASLCAEEQGQFWKMHDLLFREQRQLGVGSLKDKARRLGLDQKAFDACLDSGRHAERVQKDMREGAIVGVTGTPALFVNGIPAPSGAIPYETVSEFIEEELRRLE
jgi:protein-disulfide isomerase